MSLSLGQDSSINAWLHQNEPSGWFVGRGIHDEAWYHGPNPTAVSRASSRTQVAGDANGDGHRSYKDDEFGELVNCNG